VAYLRTRLVLMGLDAARIATPAASPSGGERLKAALACVLDGAGPPQLLLLDEPDNHLDLASKEALEEVLRGYPGALVVVSHEDAFLDWLGLDTRLQAGPEGWVSPNGERRHARRAGAAAPDGRPFASMPMPDSRPAAGRP